MKVNYVTVDVRVDARTSAVKDVMVQEVPLLRMKHGESSVTLYERQTDASREVDDFKSEFGRLETCYGYTSNKEDAPTFAVALWGNPEAGGVERLKESASKKIDELGLLREGMNVPTLEHALTNDEQTSKLYKRAPKSEGVNLKAADMRDALGELDIEFDPSMKAKELAAFGTSAMMARAGELGLETEGLGSSDLFDAIVEAE